MMLTPGAARASDPHEFDDCGFCHRQPTLGGSTGKSDHKEKIDALCVECHPPCLHGKKHRGSPGSAGGAA